MKNLIIILVIIVVVGGTLFALARSGSQKSTSVKSNSEGTQSSALDKKEVSLDIKQYKSSPAVMIESDLVGRKARFETNQGNFVVNLFGDKAPKTVSNFIFLAKDGLYNDLTFHRVIEGFMIQGGDPAGDGTGGPGYKFEDEFNDSLTFSKPAILAMANSGPDTNGSQFFITVAPTPHLNGLHTIFGEVTEGYDVVEKISRVETGASDKPKEAVIIKKIEIL